MSQLGTPALLACLALVAPADSQRVATGTATVSGVVVTLDSQSAAVRRAVVTLEALDGTFSQSRISDESGRFVFDNLPAGRFHLRATKPGFVETEFGARRPGRRGTPLAVRRDQVVDGLRLDMARGAVLTGTVRTPDGIPAPDVQIFVAGVGDRPRSMTPTRSSITTDDRGVYRAFGLTPGQYVVAAVPFGETANGLRTPGEAEIDRVFARLERGGLPPPVTTDVRPAAETPTVTYAPIFHPRSPSRAQAIVVNLGVGEERGGVDILLFAVPTATVEGVVVGAERTGPPSVEMAITGFESGVSPRAEERPLLDVRPGADGRFRYSNLIPGHYTLTARTAGDTPLFATTEFDISGSDVSGLTLSLRPALSITGRVVFTGSTANQPDELTTIRVRVESPRHNGQSFVTNGVMYGQPAQATARLDEDGSFALTGLLPEQYLASVQLPSDLTGWWLRSAMVGERDVLDEPWDLREDIGGVVLTLTDQNASVSGVLQAADGTPAAGFDVVLISADRTHWWIGSRRTRSTRPSTDGQFHFDRLPAGRYLLAALEDPDPDALGDPGFLEAVAQASVLVEVADGQRVTQNLRVAR